MPAGSRPRASQRTTSSTARPPARRATEKMEVSRSAKSRLFLGVQRRAVCHARRTSRSLGAFEAIAIGHLDRGQRMFVEHGVIGNNLVQVQDVRGDGVHLIGGKRL